MFNPREQTQNTPADVADVLAPLAQQGIAAALQIFESLGVIDESGLPGKGGTFLLRDHLYRLLQQIRVFQQGLVHRQNIHLRSILERAFERINLLMRLRQCGVQLGQLLINGAALLDHLHAGGTPLHNLPDRQAGRGRNARQHTCSASPQGLDGAGQHGGSGFEHGHEWCWHRPSLLPATLGQHGRDAAHRLSRIDALGFDVQHIAMRCAQAHDGHQGLGIGLLRPQHQPNIGLKLFGLRRQHRCGACMQTRRVGQHHRITQDQVL